MENTQEPTSFLDSESKWNYLNCIYFGFVVSSTVGYGDFFPVTWYGRLYFFFYAFFAIVVMGTSIAIMGSIIVLLVQTFIQHSYTAARRLSSTLSPSASPSPDPTEHERDKKRRTPFHLRPLVKAIYMFLFIILYLLAGAMLFALLEGWAYYESMYFAFVSLCTIGFGDMTVQTNASKLLLVAYLMGGLGAVASLIGFVAEEVLRRVKNMLEEKAKKRAKKYLNKKMKSLVLTTGLDLKKVHGAEDLSADEIMRRLTQELQSASFVGSVSSGPSGVNPRNDPKNRISRLHPDEEDEDMVSNPDLDFSGLGEEEEEGAASEQV